MLTQSHRDEIPEYGPTIERACKKKTTLTQGGEG